MRPRRVETGAKPPFFVNKCHGCCWAMCDPLLFSPQIKFFYASAEWALSSDSTIGQVRSRLFQDETQKVNVLRLRGWLPDGDWQRTAFLEVNGLGTWRLFRKCKRELIHIFKSKHWRMWRWKQSKQTIGDATRLLTHC